MPLLCSLPVECCGKNLCPDYFRGVQWCPLTSHKDLTAKLFLNKDGKGEGENLMNTYQRNEKQQYHQTMRLGGWAQGTSR